MEQERKTENEEQVHMTQIHMTPEKNECKTKSHIIRWDCTNTSHVMVLLASIFNNTMSEERPDTALNVHTEN